MEKICGIYCILNKFNGKRYIGLAKNIKNRWSNHRMKLRKNSHSNLYLQRAYNKYGEDAFEYSIIQECKEGFLKDMEIYWIAYYNSFIDDKCGYNLTRGGDGLFSCSEEIKDTMSKSMSGENNPFFGKVHTDESKKFMSDSKIGDKNPFFGQKHTDEYKEKMAKLSSERECTEETRKKIGDGNRGKVLTEETKSLMSESRMGRIVTEETRIKIAEGHVGIKNTKNPTSLHLGVFYVNRDHSWVCEFKVERTKKKECLGYFHTEQEAIDAWEARYVEYLKGLEDNNNGNY